MAVMIEKGCGSPLTQPEKAIIVTLSMIVFIIPLLIIWCR